MSSIDLTAAPPTEPPSFDGRGRGWPDALPLAHPAQAQQQLLQRLDMLSGSSLAAGRRLKRLEPLREPIIFVQNECARRFVAKPLPLTPAEQTAYETGQALWAAAAANYLRCLEDSDDAALILERAMAAASAAIKDAYRAGASPRTSDWRRLHEIYHAAEARGLAPAGRAVAEQYVETLLLAAAHPFELSPKQLALVTTWAQRWAGKVAILSAPPAQIRTRPLVVDLEGGKPAVPSAGQATGPEWRWLALDALRKSLKKRLVGLARGDSPKSLGLGSECVQPGCEILLKEVYRLWCKARSTVKPDNDGRPCHLAGDIEAIHFFLSGQPFRQPGGPPPFGKREHEQIATFGRIVTRHAEDFGRQYAPEAWRISEEATADLRIWRALDAPGMRLSRGQLVAVRQDGAKTFMLAILRWAAFGEGRLEAGVRLLPGEPLPVALRGTGIGAENDRFCQGLRLPAVEELCEPASILMPKGYFRSGRVIEIRNDQARRIRLNHLLERGPNFERADFEWI